MSKIQDAINAERNRIRGSSIGSSPKPFGRSVRGELPAAANLGEFPKLEVDARQMERSCLLPFVNDGAAINSYKLLRTRVVQKMREQNWQSLMVTGTLPNEGKTTTAINLAIGASLDVSQSVLLVDLDMERPAIGERLGLPATTGLSDYLRGKADWKEILYNTDLDRLAVLPNFEKLDSAEASISPKILSLLDNIKRIDRELLIIFDMPPILSSDTVLAIGPHIDALLYVISEGRTNRSLLQRANEMIEGMPNVGTVLNRSSEGNSGYY